MDIKAEMENLVKAAHDDLEKVIVEDYPHLAYHAARDYINKSRMLKELNRMLDVINENINKKDGV